jgi:hypothetical protein
LQYARKAIVSSQSSSARPASYFLAEEVSMESNPARGEVVLAPHPLAAPTATASVRAVFQASYVSGQGVCTAVVSCAGKAYEVAMSSLRLQSQAPEPQRSRLSGPVA